MRNLAGKTALVTGASRGIGRASALALARGGAQVLIHRARGTKEAEGVAAEIRKSGGRADAVAADLAAPDGPPTLSPGRFATSSATDWTSSSQTLVFPRPRLSKRRRSMTSTNCSQSMSVRPTSSCNNCFRSYAAAVVSSFFPRLLHAHPSQISRLMLRQRAQSTPW